MTEWPDTKSPRVFARGLSIHGMVLVTGLIDVIADYAPEHGTGDTADNGSFHSTRNGTKYGTRATTNCRITPCVFLVRTRRRVRTRRARRRTRASVNRPVTIDDSSFGWLACECRTGG